MRHILPLFIFIFFLLPRLTHANEHIVRQGDTITFIARQYAVSKNDLIKLNRIKNQTKLQLGDLLIIPDRLVGNARKKYRIRQGDTIAKIARAHSVERAELRKLNHIKKNGVLKLGRILAIPNPPGDTGPVLGDPNGELRNTKASPKKVTWAGGIKGLVVSGRHCENGILHTVQQGQTLSMISRAYLVDKKQIERRNKIRRKNPLKPGQEILIPNARRPIPVRTSKYQPHSIQFVRIKKTKRMKIKLLRRNGVIRPQGKRALGRLLGYRRMHPMLADRLQRVAERFPNHAIEITSGYRKPIKGKKKQSMHAKGRAVDFRVQGVSNELLYEFISSLENVGAGYYPNSIHVHLDTRDKKYLWTDVSGRGERANYLEPGETGHFSTIAGSINDDGEISLEASLPKKE